MLTFAGDCLVKSEWAWKVVGLGMCEDVKAQERPLPLKNLDPPTPEWPFFKFSMETFYTLDIQYCQVFLFKCKLCNNQYAIMYLLIILELCFPE